MLLFGDAAQILTPGAIHLLVLIALAIIGVRWLRRSHVLRLRTSRRLQAALWVLGAWVWIFSTPALASLALAMLEGEPQPVQTLPDQAGNLYVVIGAGTPARDNIEPAAQLTIAGWRRITAALDQRERTGGSLLLAGGLGTPANPESGSVAVAMARVARQRGVPETQITAVAHESANTYEDVLATRDRVLAHRGQVWFVTSAAHMPRTLAIARHLGMSPTPLPCDYRQLVAPGWRSWLPNHGGPAFWQITLHELIGLAVYQLRGWV